VHVIWPGGLPLETSGDIPAPEPQDVIPEGRREGRREGGKWRGVTKWREGGREGGREGADVPVKRVCAAGHRASSMGRQIVEENLGGYKRR